MIHAIYNRFHETKTEEFDSLKEAAEFLTAGGEAGSIFPLGIYDSEKRQLCLPSFHVVGVEDSTLSDSAKEAARPLGFTDSDAVVRFVDLIREGEI